MKRYVFKEIARLRCLLFLPILPLAVQFVHAGGAAEQASSKEYQERPTLESSLFPSDKAILDEETIQRILTSKFSMPKAIKMALFRLQDNQQQAIRYYGYGYWRSEEYLKIQQSFIDTISAEISKSAKVIEVASLPSILTPKEPSLPSIRETAVRMQADILMVLRISTDVYEKSRLFQASQAKAFCTCEAFLLDVRTGLIPFSSIITRDFLATQQDPDANFDETMVRAQKEAALLSLKALGQSTLEFLESIPITTTSELPKEEQEPTATVEAMGVRLEQ